MIYEVTQFGLPKNIAAGVTEALRLSLIHI